MPPDPTPPPSGADWRAISALFDAAMDQPADQRGAYVRAHADSERVASQVRAMIAAAATGDDADGLPTGGARGAQPPIPEPAIGTRVGPWQLDALMGRGGMGTVFAGRRVDADFDQPVAIKILALHGASARRRFHSERQLVARLDHPSVARLIDGGDTADGQPYMVMERIDGVRITDHARASGWSTRQRLTALIDLCEAVAHAHQQLVVHRDIKPDNILVDASGRPRLLDFGIATALAEDDAQPALTTQHQLTPSYAAPEQLLGEPVSTVTDIYALGALAHELLTDRPLRGDPSHTPAQMVSMALIGQHPRLRDARAPHVPASAITPGLEAIVAKALRRDPAHRYATAQALADDLRREAEGRAVKALQGHRIYRLRSIVRRHRVTVAAAALVAISVVAGLVATSWMAHRATVARDAAAQTAARAQAVNEWFALLLTEAADAPGEPPAIDALLRRNLDVIANRADDDTVATARLLFIIGRALGNFRDVVTARAAFDRVLEIGDTVTLPPLLTADTLLGLAQVELLEGDGDAAGALRERARAVMADQADDHPEFRARSLRVAGWGHSLAGESDAAITALGEAAAILEDAGLLDIALAANVNGSLGTALVRAGRRADGIDAYTRARDISQQLGLFDSTLFYERQIAAAQGRAGQLDAAHAGYAREIDQRRRLGLLNNQSGALGLKFYGESLRLRGDTDAALAVFGEAMTLVDELGIGATPVHATLAVAHARAHLDAGAPDAAIRVVDTLHAQFQPPAGIGAWLVAAADGVKARALVHTENAGAAGALVDDALDRFANAPTGLAGPRAMLLRTRAVVALADDRPGDAVTALVEANTVADAALEPSHYQRLILSAELAALRAMVAGKVEPSDGLDPLAGQYGERHWITDHAARRLAELRGLYSKSSGNASGAS